MTDSISITIEETKIEIDVEQPNFIQVNLLEPQILPQIAENTNHREGSGTDHSAVDEVFNRPQKVEKSKLDYTVGENETVVISLNDQGWAKVTVTGNNATITITNWPAAGKAGYLTLQLFGAGSYTGLVITNSETGEGGALILSTGRDKLQLSSIDAGVIVDVDQVNKDYS